MKKVFVLFATMMVCAHSCAQNQDLLDFQKAKVTFEKYNDYVEAEKLMKPIYAAFKSDTSFIYLYAKVLKCLKKYKEALIALQIYNAVTQDSAIDEEIAELNYQLKAYDLNGQWSVIFSNRREYLTSILKIKCDKNRISIKNSWENEYGSAILYAEDENYIKFKGKYYATYYTITTTVHENINSERIKILVPIVWRDVYYTYDKKEKKFLLIYRQVTLKSLFFINRPKLVTIGILLLSGNSWISGILPKHPHFILLQHPKSLSREVGAVNFLGVEDVAALVMA